MYNQFIELGCNIAEHLCMVTKNDWLQSETLKNTRDRLIKYGLCSVINYPIPRDIFKNVDVSVGIFYCRLGYKGKTHYTEEERGNKTWEYKEYLNTFSCIPRAIEQYSIMTKVTKLMERSFGDRMVPNLPFGIETNLKVRGSEVETRITMDDEFNIRLLVNNTEQPWVFIRETDVVKNKSYIKQYNVICGKLINRTRNCISSIKTLSSGEICSGSYSVLYSDQSASIVSNVEKYMKTNFCRALVYLKANNACRVSKDRFKYVPDQDFTSKSKIDWSKPVADIDKQLYEKYKLSDKEIEYIENTMKAME